CLKTHFLIAAIEQLTQTLDCAGRQFSQPGSQSVGRFWPTAGISGGTRHPPTKIVAWHDDLLAAIARPTMIHTRRSALKSGVVASPACSGSVSPYPCSCLF